MSANQKSSQKQPLADPIAEPSTIYDLVLNGCRTPPDQGGRIASAALSSVVNDKSQDRDLTIERRLAATVPLFEPVTSDEGRRTLEEEPTPVYNRFVAGLPRRLLRGISA